MERLIENAQALLDLDADGALVPHGIGGHARTIITEGIAALTQLQSERDKLMEVVRLAESALRPFADLVKPNEEHGFRDDDLIGGILLGDLRKARDVRNEITLPSSRENKDA